jgi:hypothetical protein
LPDLFPIDITKYWKQQKDQVNTSVSDDRTNNRDCISRYQKNCCREKKAEINKAVVLTDFFSEKDKQ